MRRRPRGGGKKMRGAASAPRLYKSEDHGGGASALTPAGRGRTPRGPHVETPLQRFLDARSIPSARIEAKLRERLQQRAPGRAKMARLRLGRKDPSRTDMVWILWAAREITGDQALRAEDLFNLDPDDPGNWT